MSVYKPKSSPFYQYDFQLDGHRFNGTTKARNKRDAEAIERQAREQAREAVKQLRTTGKMPLTIDMAVGRYYLEKGQHRDNPEKVFASLERLVSYFGKHKRMDQIDDAAIIDLVAYRRKQPRWGKFKLKNGNVKTVANGTINREVLVPLKTIFRRARLMWKFHLPDEPHWKEHWLKEPPERVRELHGHEGEALDRSVREDYRPWRDFLHISARRLSESLIRWPDVNWEAGEITTEGKGGRKVWTPITPSIRAILESCRGHHPEFVFTFVAQRTRDGRIAGQRYPITKGGAVGQWRRDRARSGVEDFRIHDHRHDRATKLLRQERNLKLVQRALNHANITTTAKYAHVMDDEVASALERSAKSRNESRTIPGDDT
ncbi:tyrosine-type recombinase/integrase [Rhizobium leguminosarum]